MCDQAKSNVNQKSSGIETNSLSNSCSKNVFLMTLVVNVCANKKIINVRALIDSGSRYSYISKHVIQKLGLKSNNKIKMQHQLFGGRETQNQSHDKICGKVPKVSNPVLSDLAYEDCEIDLLLGANVAGLLFMGGSIELESGLFLLRTCLGFVLTGKQ
ncbi:DUF1758 domain-containing protein [Trichonephila clavata]|uniref:DUF1758 domain-containing protein n=1 Tax=Trichonephila clavata TaxID=2740835 RepID=A0A8X6LWL8_TRICU|nr:DUF1758 domain-containing protein [Trichonephila clavata]